MKTIPSFLLVAISLMLFSLDVVAQAQPAPPVDKLIDMSSLSGKWYAGGDANRICYVANSGDKYFAINDESRAAALTASGPSNFIAKWPDTTNSGMVLQKYIIWNCNQWWSRDPIVQSR